MPGESWRHWCFSDEIPGLTRKFSRLSGTVGFVEQQVPDGPPLRLLEIEIGIPKISSDPAAALNRRYRDTPPHLCSCKEGNVCYRNTPNCFIARVFLFFFFKILSSNCDRFLLQKSFHQSLGSKLKKGKKKILDQIRKLRSLLTDCFA